jgi:ribosome-associated translation inhibitor RaiA
VKIDIEGLDGEGALRSRIERRMGKVLDRVQPGPTSATVNFTDVNGPKGGVDSRCAVTVRIPRRRPVHVEALATIPWLAFSEALATLDRQLRKLQERVTARQRRPKKYYVAKRLLESEAGSTVTRRRRRRPRRPA